MKREVLCYMTNFFYEEDVSDLSINNITRSKRTFKKTFHTPKSNLFLFLIIS